MLQQLSEPPPTSPHAERGSIVVLFSIVLISLISLIGLAVDAGNLYRAQLALQNAADATAFATINYITTVGYNELEVAVGAETLVDQAAIGALFTEYLRPKGEKILRVNMMNAGLADSTNAPIVIDRFEYLYPGHDDLSESAAYAITVTLSRPIQYYIMDSIPFLDSPAPILSASATTERKIANLAMMLDLSGSMGCPATGPCDCLASAGGPGCPASGRRFDSLVDAVKSFVLMFQTDRDRIALVPFDLMARSFSLKQFADQIGVEGTSSTAQVEAIAEAIRDVFEPHASTNICDALTEALAELDRLARNESQSYVLFTDGAPSAGRFLFTDSARKGNLDTNNLGFGNYDYVSYMIEWLRNPENIPVAAGTPTGAPDDLPFFAGPSLLVNSDTLRGPSLDSLSVPLLNPAAPPRPAGVARCNDGLASAPAVGSVLGAVTAAEQVFGPCLTKLEAHVPGVATETYGPSVSAGSPFRGWQEMYYHCAIQLADYARNRDGVVYGVGLGDPGTSDPTDPYQNIYDRLHRKDVFLSRIALDLQEARKFTVTLPSGEKKPVEFSYPGYNSYESLPPGSVEEQAGIYLPTQDATQLRLLFRKIARRVLLKLVS